MLTLVGVVWCGKFNWLQYVKDVSLAFMQA
jgi:hypothetical protein